MDEEEYHLDEEELQELQFNIFNSDINLLSVHILLEAFYRGETILTLGNFIKGNYWKIDEISDEARDTGDFASTQDLVLAQVIHTIQNLELGKIKKISVVGLNELLETVVKEAMQSKVEKDELDDLAGYYCAVIDNVHKLKKLSEKHIDEMVESGKFEHQEWRKHYDRVDLTVDSYYRHLEAVVFKGIFCHSGENYGYGSKWTFEWEQGISYSRFGRVRLVGIFFRYTHGIGRFFFRSTPQSTLVLRTPPACK